jgi:hypothetical protein
MAHWAELDDNNIVIRVLVGDNNDPAGDEGYQWLIDNLGGTWIKTSYNSDSGKHYREVEGEPIETEPGVFLTLRNKVESDQQHLRYNFAGPGYLYDPIRDAFIPPKPFESWVLNEDTCNWDSPVPRPEFDPENPVNYVWNEELVNWEEVSE